jgi:hypothetical protein
MDFDLILLTAFLVFFLLFTAVILLQRAQWCRKKAVNKSHRGFYPTAAALSLALISLQTLAQPDLQHSIEQRHAEADEEEDNGDLDDPFTQLNFQLKSIRNGQSVDTLKVPLSKTQLKY